MTEKEYIEREAAVTALARYFGFTSVRASVAVETVLATIPAADVVEVRHGRWVHGREVGREYLGDCLVRIFYDRWTCSECGYVVDDHEYSRINYKFCPNCGARMDGGVDK